MFFKVEEEQLDLQRNLNPAMPFPPPALRAARRLPTYSAHPLLSASRIPRQQPIALPVIRRKLHQQSQQKQHYQKKSFFTKLREALKNTKTEWYAIPFGIGVGVVGITQVRKNAQKDFEKHDGEDGAQRSERQIKPMGAWYKLFPSLRRLCCA